MTLPVSPYPRNPAALLARVRRIPFPVLAAAVGVLWAAAGVVVLDDYGAGPDYFYQRATVIANADYIMGRPRRPANGPQPFLRHSL